MGTDLQVHGPTNTQVSLPGESHVPNGCPPTPPLSPGEHLNPKELVPLALPARLEERHDRPPGWGTAFLTTEAHCPSWPVRGRVCQQWPGTEQTLASHWTRGSREAKGVMWASGGEARPTWLHRCVHEPAMPTALRCESSSAKTLRAQRA